MSDFGFVGQAYEAASPTQDNQVLINWYPESDPTKEQGARGVIALYPTPGLVTKAQLIAGEARGYHVMPGSLILLAVVGPTVYSITPSYVATVIGSLATSTGRVWIADNIVAAYFTDGVNRYSYTFATGVFQIKTDGAFVGADTCDGLDNFIVYNRPGTNQWGCTDVGAVDSNALNLGQKLVGTDNIVAVMADHRQVLVMGERTSERWIDVGTQPFPFQAMPGSAIQHGLQAKGSLARLGEGIAFLALDDRGQATVVTWGASFAQPLRISTFAVEDAIQKYAVTSDAIAYCYSQSGHEFYVLTFPSANVTWVFDLATQMWHKRAWRDPNSGTYNRHRTNCAIPFNEEIIAGDWQNGKLYALSQTTYTDDGDPLPCVRRCPHLTQDLKRVYHNDLQIQFQPGVGLQTGQGSDPECILRWSNDGGFTWGNDHILKIGKAGEYKRRAMKRRLGQARDRVYEVVCTDPVYRVVVSANLNASAGAS